jgi:hypothetical protein
MVYNRREDERMLTAIALCSTKGFVGYSSSRRRSLDLIFFILLTT